MECGVGNKIFLIYYTRSRKVTITIVLLIVYFILLRKVINLKMAHN